VVLSERPRLGGNRSEPDSPKSAPKQSEPKGNALHLGITLAELTAQMAADKRLTGVRGLYIEDIDPNGLVAEVRVPPSGAPALSEGDVITRINRVSVSSLAEFQRVLSGLKPGDPIVLNVTTSLRDSRGERLVPRIVQFTYQ
ncbi:MAG TPA: PDZ domain-containing protein, partial [Pyrinomonadaceae bacterium]